MSDEPVPRDPYDQVWRLCTERRRPLWGLLLRPGVQIRNFAGVPMILAEIAQSPLPQGFGAHQKIRSNTHENRRFSTLPTGGRWGKAAQFKASQHRSK